MYKKIIIFIKEKFLHEDKLLKFIKGLADFSIFKKIKINSIFNFSKNKSVHNTNIIVTDNKLLQETLSTLPISRKENVTTIIQSTENKKMNTKPIETEWLGPFIEGCKDVRDKNLQKIWSDILSGKMNKTQTTSIRTMSLLSKINSSEAKLFDRFLRYKIGNFVYYQENKMPKDFLNFGEISTLLEIGLVKQMMNVAKIIYQVNVGGENIGFIGQYYGYLLFTYLSPNVKEIKIPAVIFSKAGLELSQFVDHQIDKGYLSLLSAFLRSYNLQLKRVLIGSPLSHAEDVN